MHVSARKHMKTYVTTFCLCVSCCCWPTLEYNYILDVSLFMKPQKLSERKFQLPGFVSIDVDGHEHDVVLFWKRQKLFHKRKFHFWELCCVVFFFLIIFFF